MQPGGCAFVFVSSRRFSFLFSFLFCSLIVVLVASSPPASQSDVIAPSDAPWHVGRLHAQPRSPRDHARPFTLKVAETITPPEGSCFLKTQYKKDATGVWATHASYDHLHRLFMEDEINYAKIWPRDLPVKPYAWFRFGPAEKHMARNLLTQSVAHLRGISDVFAGDFDILENIAFRGVDDAYDYDEFVLIWNNKRHFANTAAFLVFIQQVQLGNGLRPYNGFAGEPAYSPRAAIPFPGSVERCALESVESPPTVSPGWKPFVVTTAMTLDGFKRCCVTAIDPESVEIPVVGSDRRDQNYVSVEALQGEGFLDKILRVAKSHHPGFRIDRALRQGAKYLIFFTIDGFEGFRCPHGKEHSKGYLQAVYETTGIATFRCMNTGDDCDDFAIGIGSKAESWRRWKATFQCIVEMCCNRPDFPISEEQCNVYGMRELKEFYSRRAPDFNFDSDFGFHPPGDPRQKAVGWNYEFVEELNKDGLEKIVDYVNLFIGILPSNKLLVRTLGSTYRVENLSYLKDAITAALTYTIVPENERAPKKKLPVLKEWIKSPRRAMFLSSTPGPLDIFSFVDWNENVNTLTLPNVNKDRARAAVHATNRNDVNFLRYMRETALEFWCLAESTLQKDKTKDLLEGWIGRVLFQIAQPIHVMCILDSKEGGTGKSTLGDFLAKALQPENVHSTNMYEFSRESFNAELHDRLLIRFDDVSKEVLSEKKFEQLAAFMKQRITEAHVTTKKKFGTNSATRRTISNFFGCTNGGDIPGINPDGTERRVLICPVGDLDQQTVYLMSHPFRCEDEICKAHGCKHAVTTARQFWALFHNLCIDPKAQYFDVMIGLWLEAFESRQDNDIQMHLLLQETKIVQQQKEKRTEPVIKWWRDAVKLKRLFNSQDRRELQKITLILPALLDPNNPASIIDPNDYADKWIPEMGVASLHKLFQRARPDVKISLEEFERSFGLMLEKITRFPSRSQQKACFLWTYQQTSFGDTETWEWKKTSKDSADYFIYVLPERYLQPKPTGVSEKEQMDVRDSIFKWSQNSRPLAALASAATDLNRTMPEVSSSVSLSQYEVGDEDAILSGEPEDAEAIPMGCYDDEDAQDGLDSYERDSFIAESDEECEVPKKRRAKPASNNSPTKQSKTDKGKEEDDELEIFLSE